MPTPLSPVSEAAGDVKPSEDARARLLHAGLRLFAQQGYSKTSTRELAEAAGANVASISYYFGDKAGLYRAVSFEPLGSPADDIARFVGAELTLSQALRGYYDGFLEPLKQGDVARLCMKLHFRELLEPTGLWDEQIAHGIKPLHDALVLVLCRHFVLDEPDVELHRLAICLAGLGVHMHVGRDINEQLVPGISEGEQAIDQWADTLVKFALAMVQAEATGRGLSLSGESIS